MAVLALFSLGLRLYIVSTMGDLYAAYLLPICRMDGFMIGGIISVLYIEGRLASIPSVALNSIVVLGFGAFLVMTAVDANIFSPFSVGIGYALYVLFYSAALAKILLGSFRILSTGPLKQLGVVSYFVYLFHFPIVYGVSYILASCMVRFLITLGVVLATASLSWFWFEEPLIERGRLLKRKYAAGNRRAAMHA